MRIIDRLVGDPVFQAHLERSGRIRRVEASDNVRRLLSDCHLRFVVDKGASQQCADLMRAQPEIFDVDSHLLRLPAENCWIEFYEDGDPGPGSESGSSCRHGILAETDRSGRRGTLRSFLEQSDGSIIQVPGAVDFDLDAGMVPDQASEVAFRMRNASLPGLDTVLGNALFRPDPTWHHYYQRMGAEDRTHFLNAQVEHSWYALPYALCFSALLNTKSVLRERPSDLDRLNRARARRGRHALLDHVEVSLQLGAHYERNTDGGSGSVRRTPRLHVVRGHPVQRAGKTFWRATHIRGEGEQIGGSRTVSVRPSR